MKKELKQQIKQDEFASGLGMAAGWLQVHAQEVKLGVITLVVVGLGAYAIGYYQAQKREAAELAMAGALDILQAPVTAERPQGTPPAGGPVFATSQEKYQKAVEAFDAVARDHGSSQAGQRAKYYAALARIELGQTAEAEKALVELSSRRGTDDLEPALARVALAELHRRTGQVDKAIEEYRKMAGDATLALPKDHLQMRLASALEEAKRAGEAASEYRQLIEKFPSSVYAAEARTRADYLQGPKG